MQTVGQSQAPSTSAQSAAQSAAATVITTPLPPRKRRFFVEGDSDLGVMTGRDIRHHGDPSSIQGIQAAACAALNVSSAAVSSVPLNARRVKVLNSLLGQLHSRLTQRHALIDTLFQKAWSMEDSPALSLPSMAALRLRNYALRAASPTSGPLDMLPDQHPLFGWFKTVGRQLAGASKGKPDLVLHRAYALMAYYLQLLVYSQTERRLGTPSISTIDRDEGVCPSILLPCLEDQLSVQFKSQLEVFFAGWQQCQDETSTQAFLSDAVRQKWLYSLFALGLSQERLVLALNQPTRQAFLDTMMLRLKPLITSETLRGVNQHTPLHSVLNLRQPLEDALDQTDRILRKHLQDVALQNLIRVGQGQDPQAAMRDFLTIFEASCERLTKDSRDLNDQVKILNQFAECFVQGNLLQPAFDRLSALWMHHQNECWQVFENVASSRLKDSASHVLLTEWNKSLSDLSDQLKAPFVDLNLSTETTPAMAKAKEKERQVTLQMQQVTHSLQELQKTIDNLDAKEIELGREIARYEQILTDNLQALRAAGWSAQTVAIQTFDKSLNVSVEDAYSHMASITRQLQESRASLELVKKLQSRHRVEALQSKKEQISLQAAIIQAVADYQQAYRLQQVALRLQRAKPALEAFRQVSARVQEDLSVFEAQVQDQKGASKPVEQLISSISSQQETNAEETQWALVLAFTARLFAPEQTPNFPYGSRLRDTAQAS